MRALLTTAALLLTLPASAQIPDTLLHSIPAPPVGVQTGGQLGYSVAVEGGYTVIGAPFDDTGGQDSGVVKVFNSTTGALLHNIANPEPTTGDNFGYSVAISGTRVVIGAYKDNTGAGHAGSAYVYDLDSATPTVPVVTLNNPFPAIGDWFGNAVAISGTRVVIGAYSDDSGTTDAGSAYVYDVVSGTPSLPVITLNNPTPAADDRFGSSVAVSGTRVVVGASFADSDQDLGDGLAYVYDLSSGTPSVPLITLNNPDLGQGDHFGNSVAISGTRVVVGASDNYSEAFSAGSAYVYDLSSGTPSVPVSTLNNPTPATTDAFGWSVAISGTRVVVGAYQDDAGASNAGSAYVYDLGSVTPNVPVTTLNNPGPAVNDRFGGSVAVSGTQAVVGAYQDDAGATNAGSAYVYDFGSSTPSVPVAALNNPGSAAGDQFGTSVAVSGTRLVVGASRDDTGAANAGSVYVYDLSNGMPMIPVTTLNNPGPAVDDLFGISLAVSGTLVVVGAYQDDTGASNAGSAYVYDLSSTTPTVPVVTLNNPSPSAFDYFGLSVAISGTRVVVGAYGDDTGADGAGIAYVYELSSATPSVPVVTLNNPSPEAFDYFGFSVAISGTRVVIGAYGNETETSNAGSAYVYDLSGTTPTEPMVTLNNPAPAADDYFGNSVAISGTRVVVGASQDDTGTSNSGSAYVYDLASITPTAPMATLNKPSPNLGEFFGNSVAISGTRVVVGANYSHSGVLAVGSAYVYDLGSGTPSVPAASPINPSPAAYDNFGTSVAIDGSTLAIGTPNDDSVMWDKGYVYVFGSASDADSDGLLDSWERTYWPTTTGHGPLDDEDKDGIVNLLELAFSLNPTQGNGSPLPPAVNEGGYLTLTLTKQPGVTYEVQSAGTLLPLMPESFSAASTTVLLDNATTLKVRDNVLMSTPGGRFMRVQVTAAP